MYQHILFPVDDSPDSQKSLETVKGLALAFQAKVTLVHSFHSNADGVDLAPGHLDFVEKIFYQAGEELMEKMVTPLKAAGVNCQARLVKGHPAESILELAQTEGCDLIVMGRQGHHGHHGLKHFFLGSVSQFVLNQAFCPVLIVSTTPAPDSQ